MGTTEFILFMQLHRYNQATMEEFLFMSMDRQRCHMVIMVRMVTLAHMESSNFPRAILFKLSWLEGLTLLHVLTMLHVEIVRNIHISKVISLTFCKMTLIC